MQLQLNTDRHLRGSQALGARLQQDFDAALARFAPRITRVEVHLSDLNGGKAGVDKRCQLEARIAGRAPVSVQHVAESVPLAIDGALARLVAALDHALGKLDATLRSGPRIGTEPTAGRGAPSVDAEAGAPSVDAEAGAPRDAEGGPGRRLGRG